MRLDRRSLTRASEYGVEGGGGEDAWTHELWVVIGPWNIPCGLYTICECELGCWTCRSSFTNQILEFITLAHLIPESTICV